MDGFSAVDRRLIASRVDFGLPWHKWLVGVPLVVLPFLLGGARPWFWGPVAAVFLLGAAFLLWTEDSFAISKGAWKAWHLVLAFIFLYPFLQVLPLPLPWLAFLDPSRAQWLQRAELAADMPHWATGITYVPVATLFSWFWWVFLAAYVLIFRKVAGEAKDLGWLFRILYGVAAFEASYGLIQALVPSLGVLWEAPGTGDARGTFVNRNHYAAFLGMIWPLLMAHMLTLSREAKGGSPSSYGERDAQKQERQKQWFFAFIIGIVLLALFFSKSRGGIIGALVALTVFVSLSGRAKGGVIFFIVTCWLVMLAYGSIMGFEEILARFDMMDENAPGRFKIWEDTWRLILDHPWTGVGLGTYDTVIRLYQSHLNDQFQIGHAHNDYLELAAELGLPAAGMVMMLVWGYWWRMAMRGKRRGARGEGQERGLIRTGALAGCAAFLCHGWVEFNWQIPANQLYFVVLLVLMSVGGRESQEGRLYSLAEAQRAQRKA